MDPDEILAWKLQVPCFNFVAYILFCDRMIFKLDPSSHAQAEEDAIAAAAATIHKQHPPSMTQAQRSFTNHINDAIVKVKNYEDDLAIAMALSCIDCLDQMKMVAAENASLSLLLQEDPPLAEEDALALELISWFKRDFFKWVDKAPCDYCGYQQTQLAQMGGPNAEEVQHGAGRVEVYFCPRCSLNTRFPRYNDPVKLLETRRGRCGEWANAFCLVSRAVGLDSRLVVDTTDHIWVEYYSTALRRWIHMDPCEGIVDKPLLYEVGWGKKLQYLIAVGRDGVMDVSKRYTKSFGELQRYLDEDWVREVLEAKNQGLRGGLGEEEVEKLKSRDEEDEASMELDGGEDNATTLPGRQTGSAEWVNSRGEGGSSTKTTKTAAEGTRYQWARRELPSSVTTTTTNGRTLVCGGVCRASGENPPGETAAKAFDGTTTTKWLDFNGSQPNSAWLEYRVLPTEKEIVLRSYALVSGNDAEERDPAVVAVDAYDEGKKEWVEIDVQAGLEFGGRGRRLEFEVGKEVASRRWRVRVGGVKHIPCRATCVQLSGWELYM